MADRGYDVHVVTSPGALATDFSRTEPATMHAVEMTRQVSPIADQRALRELRKLMLRLRPDVVHAGTPKGGLLGMIAAAATRVPRRIYHVRGLPLLTAAGRLRTVLRATESVACLCAHDVVTVSASLADAMRASAIAGAGRARVLASGSSNGVDTERFVPGRSKLEARVELGLPEHAEIVACVGRLVRDKGIEELLEAWRSLRREGRVLFLVGPVEERDPLGDSVLQEIEKDPSIVHLPFTEDMPTVYAASDLVVLPSRREGFPNVPLEAAAMALPVVTTDAVGCVDSVVPNQTGAVVSVQHPQELERAMRTYLDDPELRLRHGQAGRARVLEEFAPHRIWSALDGLYREG